MSDSDAVTPGELRALARQYALILEPGELLVITVPPSWPPEQVRELNDALSVWTFDPQTGGPCYRILAVPGTAVCVGKLPEGSAAAEIEAVLSAWHEAGPAGMSLREWMQQPREGI